MKRAISIIGLGLALTAALAFTGAPAFASTGGKGMESSDLSWAQAESVGSSQQQASGTPAKQARKNSYSYGIGLGGYGHTTSKGFAPGTNGWSSPAMGVE